jgi:hypothetical protein
MKLAVIAALVLSACVATPDVDGVTACQTLWLYRCDAVKECGIGSDVRACLAARTEACDASNDPAPMTSDELAECEAHMQAHDCNGAEPVFDAEGMDCFATYR